MTENDRVKEKLLLLIETEYPSDAAFERVMGLKPKTVDNWRRDKSRSYLKMLPELSALFHISLEALMNIPLQRIATDLSDDEYEMLSLYRETSVLPKAQREALKETLETTMRLYLELKNKSKRTRS